MPIFDQGYQHWSGALSGQAWRWLTITRQGVRVEPFGRVVLEPTGAEDAGRLGVDDPLAVGVQFNIVADATAKGAGRVLYNREFHVLSPLVLPLAA